MSSPQLERHRVKSGRRKSFSLTARAYFALALLLLAGCCLVAAQHGHRLTAFAGGGVPQKGGAQATPESGLRRERLGRGPDLHTQVKALPFNYETASGEAGRLGREGVRPLALASADFDEDGVPDLVGGYAAGGGGALTLNRGNADAAYPNSPEATRRRAAGEFIDSPFLAPGRAFDLDEPPGFLGAGDFDGDGHFDVVAANRGGRALSFLRGDGRGNLSQAKKLELPGAVTSLSTGDINRADGLADVVVAVEREGGAAVLVFEGPGGALAAEPEVVPLPSAPTSMAIGQLDGESSFDLAVVNGRELFIIRGRDRKLSLDAEARATVSSPQFEREEFSSNLTAVTVGDFTTGPHHDLAVLSADGVLQILSRVEIEPNAAAGASARPEWRRDVVASGEWSAAMQLIAARTSNGLTEDVLILDTATGSLETAGRAPGRDGAAATRSVKNAVAADAGDAVAAVLPMQLDTDAIPDLVVLRHQPDALAVSLTAGAAPDPLAASPAADAQATQKQWSGDGGARDISLFRSGSPRPEPPGSRSLYGSQANESGAADTPAPSAAPCGFADSIAPGTFRDGVLGAPDCRYPLTGELFDSYTFTGVAQQRIAIEAVSNVFDPALILYAPNGVRIFQNDDNRDGTNSRIPAGGGYITLPMSGTYVLEVTTIYIEAGGPYRVSISALAPTQCMETPIESGNFFIGVLTPNSCVDNFGKRADIYSFFGVVNQQVALYMDANPFEVDPFLNLFPPTSPLISDNDGGDLFDARIPAVAGTFILPETGVYHIAATSAFAGQVGPYSLELLITGPTVVTNTNNSGVGSLRQAILNANARPGPDTITFAIGSGPRTINLLSPLPPVSGVTLIDGTTQPGFAGVPLIELNGGGIPAAGIKLTGGSSRLRGLVINRFNYGVAITDAGGNIVEGNYIGTNLSGTAALGNRIDGVVVFSSAGNLIGGTTAAARNVISGNLSVGVEIGRNGPFNNFVQGNFIGTNAAGTADLGNAGNGVLIRLGKNNLIGGTTPGARNVISGNDLPGVALGHTEPVGNLVQGNFIGTNAAGTAAIGNGGAGLIIGGVDVNVNLVIANKNTVGGTVAAARNVISGNFGQGVEINNPGSADNFVQGNFIGTNAAGTAAIGNNGVGVSVTLAPGNVIGGTVAGAGNVISGNQGPVGIGVAIGIPRGLSFGGTGIFVQGNFIGTDTSGTLRLGNAQDGVFIDAQSVFNTIANNTIAFNGRSGVFIPNNGTEPGVQIRIELNDIFANGELAIDLGQRGVTNNDPLDGDLGANLQQNFPLLQSAALATNSLPATPEGLAAAAAAVTVNGTLESTPNTTFTVQWGFTADAQCSPQNQPQSRVLVNGKLPDVQTNASGFAPLRLSLNMPPGVERGIIYTNAIDPNGNTSENSPCLTVSSTPPPAGTLQFSGASYDASEGGGSVVITITRTAGSTGVVGVDYSTADGTARAGQDYTASAGTLSFGSGVTSRTFAIPIVGDTLDENDETVGLTLGRPTGGAVLGAQLTAAVRIIDDDNQPVIQFDAASYTGSEAAGTAVVRVARGGDTSSAVSVAYETADQTASERRDYIMTLGRLEFAPGETLKTIPILVNNDAYVEPAETLLVRLLGPSAGATLGARATATVTLNSDDTVTGSNPIDATEFYVRQQYADFLNREPDTKGFAHWKNDLDTQMAARCSQLTDPGARTRCALLVRAQISAAFFLSIEFQQTGFLVIRFYGEAFGRLPRLREFTTDAQEVGRGVVVGDPGWDTLLESNRLRYAERLTQRAEFIQRYGSMSNFNFVNTLFANAGVPQGEEAALRQALVNGLDNGTETRPSVLRKVADSRAVFNRQYNPAFVLMQYFGYLRRNPDDTGFDGRPDPSFTGFNFWLQKLNTFTTADEDARDENTAVGRMQRAQMVDAFVDSIEYRTRFAP